MLVCESKGSGHCGVKGLLLTPISFSHLAFATAVLKGSGYLERRNCPSISEHSTPSFYWRFRVWDWLQLPEIQVGWGWEENLFNSTGNDFSQILWLVPNLNTILCEVRKLDIMIYSWKQGPCRWRWDPCSTITPALTFRVFTKACRVIMPNVREQAWMSTVSRHVKIDICMYK